MNDIINYIYICMYILAVPLLLFIIGLSLYPFVYLICKISNKPIPKFITPIHEMMND